MILGIISAILYLFVSGLILAKRVTTDKNKRLNAKVKKFFFKIHKPLGFLLLVVSTIHFLLSLQLINQRPLMMFLLGVIMMLSQILGILVMVFRKKIKKAILIHKLLALVMLICLILHVYFGISSLREYQDKVKTIMITETDLSTMEDGIYVGEYDVEYIYAKVAVTIEDGIISEIEILKHCNERGQNGEEVINRILEQQKLAVDAVSGATNSSNVIKKAVENALNQGSK